MFTFFSFLLFFYCANGLRGLCCACVHVCMWSRSFDCRVSSKMDREAFFNRDARPPPPGHHGHDGPAEDDVSAIPNLSASKCRSITIALAV